ncbi:MAG: hypothetical protein IPN33_06960 [Saprospiraceae bacterium]|nr:hypothetical protein [Saprospiraceae bacterium]
MQPMINNSIFTKPSNCIFGFGIPNSKESFFEDQENASKDFAKMFGGVWSRYYYQFIRELEFTEPKLFVTGLKIKHNLTLEDFHKMFNSYYVVVLFSHWKGDAVEFSDGLKSTSEIVEGIPSSFHGILDLCVCHPDRLALLIREKKPNCLVRYIPNKATPIFWLNFYLVLFSYLNSNDLSYLKALEDTIFEFLKSKS